MNYEREAEENKGTIKSMYRLLDEFKDIYGEEDYARLINKINNKENKINRLYDTYN